MKDNLEIPSEFALRIIIGNNLKALRKKHKLTQEQLANLSGINRTSIAKYESYERQLSYLTTLLSIAKALNEPPEAILAGWESVF